MEILFRFVLFDLNITFPFIFVEFIVVVLFIFDYFDMLLCFWIIIILIEILFKQLLLFNLEICFVGMIIIRIYFTYLWVIINYINE